MIQTLMHLCELSGPSGYENEVREYIRTYAQAYADDIKEDSIGNLMVFRKGNRSAKMTIMLAAHMDEVGLICKGYTEDGCIKFGFVGGVDPRVVIGRRVKFGDVTGVVGIKAVHLSTASEREHMPKTKDLYIDIGCTTQKAAEKKVPLGEYGVFDAKCRSFGDGLIRAKAIDDRLGCAILMTLMKEQPIYDTWFVFTVQEEVGLRGARCAAYAIQPDVCLVVEGTTAADIADVPKHQQVCRLREGAVLPFMDRATIYDATWFDRLTTAADKNGIHWQTKQMIAGGTDAARIHLTREGIPTIAVAAPVRYIHSPSCVTSIEDMNEVLKMARLFLKEVGKYHD